MATTQSNDHGAGLLDAQLELYANTLAVVKSMALKTAMDLGIADAIHHHGGACHPAPDTHQGHAPPLQDPVPAPPHARAHPHRRLRRREAYCGR
ncbi:hypothetical protein EE612_059414 [Oryza sativa]|nr:hypothetical protein EE612_059414 [Oryza sativa]